MTDPFFGITEQIRAAGLRPRRFRQATIAVRWLAWPVVRAWLYMLTRHIHWENQQICSALETRMSALEDELRCMRVECDALREQAQADRIRAASEEESVGADRGTIAALRHQIETLQGTLAQFTMDRAFFENGVRTEIMAVANIVDHYRDLTEQALDERWDRGHAGGEQGMPFLPRDALKGAG